MKSYNNKQKFLIICFVFDFNKNHFPWVEDDRMSLRLIYVDHERYKLKWNRFNNKFWCIDFHFDEVFEIKINQHKRFYKRFDESSKRLSRSFFKNEWFILSFLLIFFKQFRCQRAERKFCVINKHKQLVWESSMQHV